ncbi:efflux RND transporter periplasmic adaptor subunit [Microbulbifer sp. 2304DJ12-6]|uniref:efflux RND transporter periplasmic adaptor subunit n=1 Tax=Microbulbifer sp. 2304DJ12-6 TaxID=3233340 RepID=UPI0039AFDD1B
MDIPQAKQPKLALKPLKIFVFIISVIVLAAWGILRHRSDAITVNMNELVIDSVKRGQFIRDIRAPGTLQPQTFRWIAATSRARVEQILVQPGAKLEIDTIIMRLSNPTLTRELERATYALEVAQAEFNALGKRLKSDALAQEAMVIDYQARFENADFRLKANEALKDLQIVSVLDVKENKLLQQQYQSRLRIEKKRLQHLKELHLAELAAKQAQVNQARSALKLQQNLESDLNVKAGLTGVLQFVPVEQGQQLNTGDILARVAREEDLKAELRVQESLIKDVVLGQKVVISAGGNRATGSISRIDPAVQNGVVLVDVIFDEASLTGARPDLRVNGVIEIERVENALTIRRPVQSQENSNNNLYLVNERQAKLVAVSLGSGSVDRIHVTGGLQAGDKVIVSEISQFNQRPLISLQ